MQDEEQPAGGVDAAGRLARAAAAVAAEPSSVARRLELAGACEEAGQAADAEQQYRLAADLDPADAEVHYQLGLLLKEQGRLGEAQAEFEEFLERARPAQERGAADPVSQGKALLAGGWGLAYEKCAGCGCISTLGSLYRSTAKGKLCPGCRGQAQLKKAIPSVWVLVLAAATLVLGYFVAGPVHFLYANGLLIIGFSLLMVVPHELGHAAAAWLLGGRVFELRLGAGPARWEKRLRGTWLGVTKYPSGGRCVAAFPVRERIRLRAALLTAGGLGVNLLLIVLLAPAYDGTSMPMRYAPLEALFLANVVMVVAGLWPRLQLIDGLEQPSDGLQLLHMVRGSVSADAQHVNYFQARAVYALKDNAPHEALAAADEGLALYPGSTPLAGMRAIALLALERHAEAAACFDAALAHFEAQSEPDPGLELVPRPLSQAVLLNNAAYGRLLAAASAADRARAADLARRAYRLTPWQPYIRGTWGAALVEIGRPRAALVHLRAAVELHDTARGRAINLTWAARAVWHLGEVGQALALLEQALALDPQRREYEVRRAEAEVRAVAVGSSPGEGVEVPPEGDWRLNAE